MEENNKKKIIIISSLVLVIIIVAIFCIIKLAKPQKTSNEKLMNTPNLALEAYIGDEIKGSQIKTLCSLVSEYNSNSKNKISINNITKINEIDELKETFNAELLYNVSATYSSVTTQIESISITESKVNVFDDIQ